MDTHHYNGTSIQAKTSALTLAVQPVNNGGLGANAQNSSNTSNASASNIDIPYQYRAKLFNSLTVSNVNAVVTASPVAVPPTSTSNSQILTQYYKQQQQRSVDNAVVAQVNNGSLVHNNQGNGDSNHTETTETPKKMVVVATPQQVMVHYMNKLTPYEHHEIFKYPEIYFIGANAKKRQGIGTANNSDYDNEQGSYIHVPHDHIAYRYEILKIIGKGSFGQVLKVYDHKTHEQVALKIVRNEKRFYRQAQEEIRILLHLRRQDTKNAMNIIHMHDYFTFRNHMCITFELLYINLYELIKKNKFQVCIVYILHR